MTTRSNRRRWGTSLAAIACALVALDAPRAYADGPTSTAAPSPDSVAQARGHFQHGVKLYGEDDFRAALIEFNRAYELAPNWAVLYNVGQSYYQLRDYANALRVLESYEKLGGANIPADRRTQVDREVEELRGRLAHVVVLSNVAGAAVTVDDAAIGETPFASPQIVGAGRHTFRATKAGYAASSKVVDIAGGDNVNVTFELAPATATVAVETTLPAHPSYVPAIVSIAVGGAGLVVGGVFGGLAVGDKSSLKGECHGTACPASAQGDINAFSRDGTISTVGFVVGGVGVAGAVVLYLLERGGKERPPAPATGASVEVRPWFGGTSAGVLGRF